MGQKPHLFIMLYVITDGDFCKIGITRNVEQRLNNLQTANPKRIRVAKAWLYGDWAETMIHEQLRGSRGSSRNEWFCISPQECISFIDKFLLDNCLTEYHQNIANNNSKKDFDFINKESKIDIDPRKLNLSIPIVKVENATKAIIKYNNEQSNKDYQIAISTRALSSIGETSLTTSTKFYSDNKKTIDEYNQKNAFNKNQNRGKDDIYDLIKQNYM